MAVEKSAGAVVFSPVKSLRDHGVKKEVHFLLLQYETGHWDFPKGNIEKGEKPEDTARREIKEETSIDNINFIPGFKEIIKYFYEREGQRIFKVVVFYLAETSTKEVKISWEHKGYKWLQYNQALKKLTFENAKDILKKANDCLSRESL